MKPAPFSQKELDREEAIRDCIESGTPTMGVDHGNHYKPSPYADKKEPDKEKDND